jgi:hypothetical protein
VQSMASPLSCAWACPPSLSAALSGAMSPMRACRGMGTLAILSAMTSSSSALCSCGAGPLSGQCVDHWLPACLGQCLWQWHL